MNKIRQIEISEKGEFCIISFNNERIARFHAVWLRDNAYDATTRHPKNQQRLITIGDIAPDMKINACNIINEFELEIKFYSPSKNLNETIKYHADFLWQNRYDKNHDYPEFSYPEYYELWDKNFLGELPRINYQDALNSEYLLYIWLANLRKYGFALMAGAPTASGSLIKIAELFSFVRHTNYGLWFEVRAEVNPNNLAYTNLGLQAHTDNPYRDPVPTMQILHALENSVNGGESIIVDGFAVAQKIYQENPEYFRLLSQYSAHFDYRGDDNTRLSAKFPIFEKNILGQLDKVRFNNRSAFAFCDIPFAVMGDYYQAYRRFAEYISDSTMMVEFKLNAGELFIVDNTRVLHARREFTGTGNRWLQGCYPDKDGFISKYTILNEKYGNK